MNFVFLSPHFPPNWWSFCAALREEGARVLGVADAPWEALRPELRACLAEYYRVHDMHDHEALLRALGWFVHRHGRLHGLDSLNEYWLETEAALRDDFNIPGLRSSEIAAMKHKSLMKEVFARAGVAVARGGVVRTPDELRALAAEVGFPLVAKPDNGVGAAATYKIRSDEEIDSFFASKPALDYIAEEFVPGRIVTYDGIVDQDGEIVLESAMEYSDGVMETVLRASDIYYWTLRDIPAELRDAGRRVLDAYRLRSRFFHLEFFLPPDGGVVGLEVNMRPPGGLTVDMIDYANDIDAYRAWAQVVVRGSTPIRAHRPYHCCYVARRAWRRYELGREQILATWGDRVVHDEPIAGVFSGALGDHGFLVRSPDLAEIHAMARSIQSLARE